MAQARRINRTKQALLSGKSVMVAEINRIPSPLVVEAVALAGFDSCWIDMEHSHIGLDDLSNMILAARAHDIDVVVRIPHGPYNQVIKTLELGANGLVWPHCKSADEARNLVHMAKYRPLGLRGMGGGRDWNFGNDVLAEYIEWANAETLLGVMIEDAEGVEAVEEIAAVEGLDLLFVGPGDLSHSYGVEREAGSYTHPRILEAFERVGAACAANGKGMGTAIGPGDGMREVVARGTRWLNCATDMGMLIDGYAGNLATASEIASTGGN